MFKNTISLALLLLTLSGFGCQSGTVSDTTQIQEEQDTLQSVPDFNADTAYRFVSEQVAFGPRVPGSEAQLNCAAWLRLQLSQNCDTVYRQETGVIGGDQKKLRCINLIGVIHPLAKKRILLLAHWDSRPWADQEDPGSKTAIDGADDGASGVAVLLELSRVLKQHPVSPDMGVDILFTDVEDYGKSEWGNDSYALGTQYWAKNPHIAHYSARAGILLDMVGARNARFPMEGYSQQHANNVLQDVWKAAAKAGYSSYFVYESGGEITDDHVPVNEIRNIPTIDIINLPAGSPTGFGAHWHTLQDNMDIIDRSTLKAVGQTLVQYLYTE